MKIAVDQQIFALQAYGGVSRYFTRLVQGLLDSGLDVGVFAPLYQNSYLPSLPKEIVHGRHIGNPPLLQGGAFKRSMQHLDFESLKL